MKLSVAMITYNHEHFLAQALESVLAQKVNFDYEIVIGEDCSTDGTRAVIGDFQRRYPGRIAAILRERNVGAVPNFAATIGICRGRYVAFLEGDDYWTAADKLQRQVDFLDSHPDYALCCHRVAVLNESGAAESVVFPTRAAGCCTIEDLLKGNFMMTCATMLRRDSIGPFPEWFFNLKLGDWPLFVMAARYGKIELMDEVLAAYRVHSGSSWSSLPPLAREREGERMLRALDEHLRFRYTRTIRETIAKPYFDRALAARARGRRAETAEHLIRYLRNGGWRLPWNRRFFAGLVAYVLVGSGYKNIFRATASGK